MFSEERVFVESWEKSWSYRQTVGFGGGGFVQAIRLHADEAGQKFLHFSFLRESCHAELSIVFTM